MSSSCAVSKKEALKYNKLITLSPYKYDVFERSYMKTWNTGCPQKTKQEND